MNPPAEGGPGLTLFTHGSLLVQNTGYDHLLRGQICIARGDSMRDTTTVTKDAGQGVGQGVGQATDQELLLEEMTE